MHITIHMNRMDGPDPPYDHNFLLGSAVYTMLREASGDAATAVHDSPYRSAYVLSEVYRVRGRPKEAWFRMGTSSGALLRLAGKALSPGTDIQIGPTLFRVTGMQIEEPVVRPGEFVTLSPILLRDRTTGKSLVHDSPGYVENLEAAMNHQVKNYLKREGTIALVHFEPQAVRKRRIKDKNVLVQKGRMLLDGDDEQLQMLVNHGVGLSPALAFGMVVPGIPLEQITMIGFDKVKRRGGG